MLGSLPLTVDTHREQVAHRRTRLRRALARGCPPPPRASWPRRERDRPPPDWSKRHRRYQARPPGGPPPPWLSALERLGAHFGGSCPPRSQARGRVAAARVAVRRRPAGAFRGGTLDQGEPTLRDGRPSAALSRAPSAAGPGVPSVHSETTFRLPRPRPLMARRATGRLWPHRTAPAVYRCGAVSCPIRAPWPFFASRDAIRAKKNAPFPGRYLEPTAGLEPATPSLRVKCSTS